jgi:sugar phosphate permease
VVAITFALGIIGSGVRSSPGVFIHPFEEEFGWSRAAIAAAISVNLVLFGLAAPISGKLIDRYGPRLMMISCLSLLATGVAATTIMGELWQLSLLWGVVVGLGAGGGASVLGATVATRWFVARRGMVLGFLGTATSTGQLIFLPLLMAIILASGWRAASLLLVVVLIALLAPVILWMRNDPADVGLRPYGEQEGPGAGAQADAPAVPLRAALRTPEFWILAVNFFVCGATANGLIGVHLIPHSIDHGIPEMTAATTVAIMGAMNFVGTMFSGWLTDRVDPRRLLTLFYGGRGLSLFILPFVTDFSGMLIFAVIYGLDWFATVPPTATLVARRFGRRSVGTIYGWIFCSHQFGAAFAASGAGAIRTWLGEYQLAFVLAGVLCMMAASLAFLIRAEAPPATAPAAALPAAA